ncbi:uncharacterized protein VICG_00409 [Vittaforma corneae ATCC 50505]|uniref:Gti1/Pac2 family protein n=1 Tax=Vittaforma corneae (strain ATCC 50505) TaxID=993615 RepID=L2GQS0_VITCO|nr:uncharacterized protein VICG_00409 [Vittaforma corneae ATCC 50505]ELA42657.1 hypothetical protein VICG_00409 [Vittaforma corneae ATCC 50505]
MRNITGYINNYEEAVLMVHAIRLGCFPTMMERLKPEERCRIESGDIFCFIENANGMKRWTDGRIWSPSKICGEFLVYQEVPRHLSKNSIKKRRVGESPYNVNLVRKEDIVDRTTLHKKTISIRLEDTTYHVISYYRPIFATYSLMDIPFFQQLNEALNLFPELKDDKFVQENIKNDSEFYTKYNIQRDFQKMVMEEEKRNALEKIAVDVLRFLWRKKVKPRTPIRKDCRL